jgi:hypothetical protein
MVKVYNFPPHIKGDAFKGRTFKIDINGQDIDASNYIIKMQLRKGMSAAYPVVYEFSTDNGRIVPSGLADGKFSIPFLAKEWDNVIEPGKYVYDMEFTLGDKRSTWIKGIWKFNRQTTQNGV